jgi:hypothetical protein
MTPTEYAQTVTFAGTTTYRIINVAAISGLIEGAKTEACLGSFMFGKESQ